MGLLSSQTGEIRAVYYLASSGAEGCIDELEIFSNGENIALAKGLFSGDFEHPLHNLKQINDGEYGNAKSWIVKQRNDGWVRLNSRNRDSSTT